MPKPAAQPTFESALERIDAIVQKLESDGLGLEELISACEEGSGLLKFCQTQLARAQQRLDIIQVNLAKEPEIAPFDAESAAKAEAPRPSAKDVSWPKQT